MSIFSQSQFFRPQKQWWLFISLYLLLSLLALTNFYKQVNFYSLQWFNQFNPSTQSEVALIEAQNLPQQHTALMQSLIASEPKAVVVLSDTQLEQHHKPLSYYPLQDPEYCLTRSQHWFATSIQLQRPNRPCTVVWSRIFDNNAEYHNKIVDALLPLHALPKYTAERVISGDVFAAQLQNKTLLVAQRSQLYNNLVSTSGKDIWPPLYLQALIANSFANDRFVAQLSDSITFPLVFLLSIALLICYQKLTTKQNFTLAVTANLLVILSSYLCYRFYALLLPVGELSTAIWLTLLWTFMVLRFSEEAKLSALLLRAQQRMTGRYLPRQFTELEEPWDAIVRLVNQQLNLNQSIFLTRLEGDHRVSEIRAVNCQLDDILEQRRDYQRAPYSDAIKASGVVKVTRPFFKDRAEHEQQYIAPLMYAGDIRGFWALTVSPQPDFDEQAFCHNVNAFAKQVGELLFHHKIYSAEQSKRNSLLAKVMTFSVKASIASQVRTAVLNMEQKLTAIESVFNQLHSASVLFNLFGQIVQVNESLEQFAKRHQITIFDMSALDLLCFCSELTLAQARGKLRYLTLKQGKVTIPVYLDEHFYLLSIRSLIKQPNNADTTSPFESSGLLFEFFDLSAQLQHTDNATQLLQRLSEQLQNSTSYDDGVNH